MDPQEIMKILSAPTSRYPIDAVQAAMNQRDDVVPLLLHELERAREDPEEYLDDTDGLFLPIFVLILLGYHRVPEAHALIVDLVSLPEELPFDLFGDAITELLPKVLWQTSSGDASNIIRLMRNKAANEYCRSSAIRALEFGVAEKRLSREEVVELLQELFSDANADVPGSLIWSSAASSLTDLWPGDSMEILQKGYDDGLIEPGSINMSDIVRYLEPNKETVLANSERVRMRDLQRTPHEDLSSWAFFKTSSRNVLSWDNESRKRERIRATAKKKRKQARKSRKKGRTGFITLHVLIFIEHARRKIVHFNISRSPFSEWAARQLTNAFPYDTAPRFLIHDRDP